MPRSNQSQRPRPYPPSGGRGLPPASGGSYAHPSSSTNISTTPDVSSEAWNQDLEDILTGQYDDYQPHVPNDPQFPYPYGNSSQWYPLTPDTLDMSSPDNFSTVQPSTTGPTMYADYTIPQLQASTDPPLFPWSYNDQWNGVDTLDLVSLANPSNVEPSTTDATTDLTHGWDNLSCEDQLSHLTPEQSAALFGAFETAPTPAPIRYRLALASDWGTAPLETQSYTTSKGKEVQAPNQKVGNTYYLQFIAKPDIPGLTQVRSAFMDDEAWKGAVVSSHNRLNSCHVDTSRPNNAFGYALRDGISKARPQDFLKNDVAAKRTWDTSPFSPRARASLHSEEIRWSSRITVDQDGIHFEQPQSWVIFCRSQDITPGDPSYFTAAELLHAEHGST